MKSYLYLKKAMQIVQKYKKNMELVQIYFQTFNKITIIKHFPAFFLRYFSIFPSWIRIQIQEGKRMRI